MNVPMVTVIMPIRNEATHIGRTLEAVLRQDYPTDRYEVIVADGDSTDATCEVVIRQFASHPDVSTSLVHNPRRIVPVGFNLALARAVGSVIVRVDGRAEIAQNYLHECVSALDRSGAHNVGGRMRPVGGGGFADAVEIATTSRFGIGDAQFRYLDGESWVDTVYLGAWPRDVFRWLGNMDEEMVRCQDDELNYRLRKLGGRILLSPRIDSRYLVDRRNPAALFDQYLQYGFWKVRVLVRHPRQMRLRQFAPVTFLVLLSCGLVGAALGWPLFAVALGFCLAAYVVAGTAAAVHACGRRRLGLWPMVLVAYATLHVSYGLGFFVGLVRVAAIRVRGGLGSALWTGVP
jgi:succinoglycan biosynthesis protein ExoA